MPSRTTIAGFVSLSLSPNSLLGPSALKDATFLVFSGKGIYGPEDTMDPAAVAVSARTFSRGGTLNGSRALLHRISFRRGSPGP